MRLRSARGLVAAIALSLPACAAPPAPGPAPAAISTARSTEVIRREGNHLVGEASPYLEQHAHNPVDWYPWSEAATARAKQEGKLVFLSIGYSSSPRLRCSSPSFASWSAPVMRARRPTSCSRSSR